MKGQIQPTGISVAKIEQDMAGKYRALVAISKDESMVFKFQKMPTDQEIIDEATRYITNRDAQLAIILQSAKERIQIEDKIASMTATEKQTFITSK